MKIREYEEHIYSADVHVEYLYSESRVIEHLFPELDDEARFGDIVSP